MSHQAELNVRGCSLRLWYQTSLLCPLTVPLTKLPLTPLRPLKLCNYSNYGISNTPDPCMTMPEIGIS